MVLLVVRCGDIQVLCEGKTTIDAAEVGDARRHFGQDFLLHTGRELPVPRTDVPAVQQASILLRDRDWLAKGRRQPWSAISVGVRI